MNRLLIVDDEIAVLNAVRRLLTRVPCTVGGKNYPLILDTQDDPFAALEQVRHTAYDLVLSDYRMPGMNGVEFLSTVRQLQPNAERLILSGYADLNALIEAINAAGIRRFIAKPWKDYELIAAIGQSLALRAAAVENQSLADEMRLARGTLTAEDLERRRLEAEEPGITHVNWGPDGSVLLDESLLDPRQKTD